MQHAAEFDRTLFIDTQRFQISPELVADVNITREYFMWDFAHYGYNSVALLSSYEQDLIDAAEGLKRRGLEFFERARIQERLATSRRAQHHEHIQRQLRGKDRFNRLQYFHGSHKTSTKKYLKALGQRVAEIIRGDEDNIIEVLEELNGLSAAFAEHAHEAMEEKDVDLDEVRTCYDCGCYHDRDNSQQTHEGDIICESCADNTYTYSECMEGYIPEINACAVYDSARAYTRGNADDYCTERYGNAHFDEHNNAFFSDTDAYYEVRGSDDEDEDGDEDEAPRRTNGLDGYHNADRHFIERNRTPLVAALGVELEVYNEDRGDMVSTLRDTFDDLILERDGSLNEHYGFEIVTQPYGPTEWADFAPKLLSCLRENDTKGYQTPGHQLYGIHINVHRRHMSPLAEARIMMMLCAEKNKNFVRAIAQRESIYSSSIDIGQLFAPTIQQITDGRGLQHRDGKRKLAGAGRYCPINWQSNIAEFRIFNSTLNEVSFMKNLEFVWALIGWTKESTGSSTCHRDFIKWVASPQQRSTYPNLLNYLSRKAFFTKGGNRIENTWLPLINKPVDTDTSELLEAA